jgi:hypothetical protein
MKRSVMPLLTAALLSVAAVNTAQSGNVYAVNEHLTAKVQECGPTFIAYNDKNLPVKTIELRNFYTGYSTTVYDPVFPYDFGEREAGVYVFTVTYATPLEGSIGIKPDVGTIWCSGPKWEASWSMSWPSHTCTPNRIKIVPDISCRE